MVRINDPSSPASKHPSVKTVVACHCAVSFDQWFVLYHACGQCLLLDPASVRGSKHGALFFFSVHVLISYCAAHKLQLAAGTLCMLHDAYTECNCIQMIIQMYTRPHIIQHI